VCSDCKWLETSDQTGRLTCHIGGELGNQFCENFKKEEEDG
jgi:hypothetical protein